MSAEFEQSPIPVMGSYRDPSGRVLSWQGRILRSLSAEALARCELMESSGVLSKLVDSALLWPSRLCPEDEFPREVREFSPTGRFIEHPRVEFISHPYEWPFRLLKEAALAHLRLHKRALELGYNLVDGSAYNIQFDGVRPFMIDTLSLVPYEEGDHWLGYRQFCEQFLNPLFLTTDCGVPYHAWYRGSLEGVPIADLAALLPWYRKLLPSRLFHVVVHAKLQKKYAGAPGESDATGSQNARKMAFSKTRLMSLLSSIENIVTSLKPGGEKRTEWGNYERINSYSDNETSKKVQLVSNFTECESPDLLWDLGCNAGFYSQVALSAGARKVIGFDIDHGALSTAVSRASAKNLDLLPLYFDATSPSPDQGWLEKERPGLKSRAKAGSLLALAFVHHIAIGRNVPLEQVVNWLIDLAPTGIIEFVPKADPMVAHMLSTREDIFATYNRSVFESSIRRRGEIVANEVVSEHGRELFWYRRRDEV